MGCGRGLSLSFYSLLAPAPFSGAVELHSMLQRQLGVSLPATLAFDYPTVAAIAAHCHQLLSAGVAAGFGARASSSEDGAFADDATWLSSVRVNSQRCSVLALHPHGNSLTYAQPQALVVIDAAAARLPAPNMSGSADTCRITPFSRWDVDAVISGISHRLGSRFGRQVALACSSCCCYAHFQTLLLMLY